MMRLPKAGSPITRRLRVQSNGWIVLETRSPGCINSVVAHDLLYQLEYKSVKGWVPVHGTFDHDSPARVARVCPMTPREKTVVRAIAKALRTQDAADMHAFSSSYGVRQQLDNRAGRARQAAELLQALVDGADR